MQTTNQDIVKPAGLLIRFAANILDAIIVTGPLVIITTVLTGFIEGNLAADFLTNGISLLYSLLLPVFWYGYTLGKRIVGIRIVKVNGEKLGIGTMLLRVVVAAIVYTITLGIALIASIFMIALRKDHRSVHDLIAGTYVTYEKPQPEQS
jgi:uncharacterized RDD family membrane protein YckC